MLDKARFFLKYYSIVYIFIVEFKGGSRHKNLCMARALGFLIRYFSNYYTLHRSDLAARAAPLDPRLEFSNFFPCDALSFLNDEESGTG